MNIKKTLGFGLLMAGMALIFTTQAQTTKIESNSEHDGHIVEQVESFLTENPKLSTKMVKIQVNNGVIYVSGLVESKKDIETLKKGLGKETHATSVDVSNLEVMELEERGK